MATASTNPLSALAMNIPAQTARGATIAGRIFGVGLALLVAFTESYNPTQVFAVVVALLIVATFIRLPDRWSDAGTLFGAGIMFFAGSVLTHFDSGLALLAMGILAALAGLALADRAGRGTAVPAAAFVAAVFVIGALQAGIVFAFE